MNEVNFSEIEAMQQKQHEEIQNNITPKQQVGIIGIPHTGLFHWQTMMALLSIRMPQNTTVKYHFVGSCLVYDAREKIVEFAMNENADWLFFLDSDMVPPHDALVKLTDLNVPIATGMAFKRTPPFQPCFYTKVSIDKDFKPKLESPIEFPDKGIIECQGFGMACALIRREVFEKVKKPYFFPFPNIGEDLSFCLRSRQAGFKMYCDLSIDCGHVSSMPIQKDHFKAAYQQYKENNKGEPLFSEG